MGYYAVTWASFDVFNDSVTIKRTWNLEPENSTTSGDSGRKIRKREQEFPIRIWGPAGTLVATGFKIVVYEGNKPFKRGFGLALLNAASTGKFFDSLKGRTVGNEPLDLSIIANSEASGHCYLQAEYFPRVWQRYMLSGSMFCSSRDCRCRPKH